MTGAVLAPGVAPFARSGGDLARDDLGMAALFLAVAGWLVFFLARQRWGRDLAPRSHDGDAIDLPEDSPALAHALHHGGVPDADVLGVVLLDLARRGYIDIVEQNQGPFEAGRAVGWRFQRREPPQGELAPSENALYTRLFATSSDTTLEALAGWVSVNRQQAKVFVDRVRRYIAAELREKGYVERPQRLPIVLNLGSASLVVIVSLAALLSGAWIGLIAGASGAAQASRNSTLRRRTAAGSTRALRWSAAAAALGGSSDTDAGLPEEAREAERLLVYAAALGVATEFAGRLEEHRPTLVGVEGFVSWYGRPDLGRPYLGAIGRFAGAVGAAFAPAVDTPGWQAARPVLSTSRASLGDATRR